MLQITKAQRDEYPYILLKLSYVRFYNKLLNLMNDLNIKRKSMEIIKYLIINV